MLTNLVFAHLAYYCCLGLTPPTRPFHRKKVEKKIEIALLPNFKTTIQNYLLNEMNFEGINKTYGKYKVGH